MSEPSSLVFTNPSPYALKAPGKEPSCMNPYSNPNPNPRSSAVVLKEIMAGNSYKQSSLFHVPREELLSLHKPNCGIVQFIMDQNTGLNKEDAVKVIRQLKSEGVIVEVVPQGLPSSIQGYTDQGLKFWTGCSYLSVAQRCAVNPGIPLYRLLVSEPMFFAVSATIILSSTCSILNNFVPQGSVISRGLLLAPNLTAAPVIFTEFCANAILGKVCGQLPISLAVLIPEVKIASQSVGHSQLRGDNKPLLGSAGLFSKLRKSFNIFGRR